MSCQQATRFITNNNHNTINNCNDLNKNHSISNNIIKENRITRVVQQEDPYVFTESVPTTPPILFNTQKTRTRLNDITSATTTTISVGKLQQQQQQQKLPLTETNGKIVATSNVTKTKASLVATPTTTVTTTTTPTTIKNVTQSLTTSTQLYSTTTTNNNNNKKLTNVCIVRPQLQQQQPHHYTHYHQQNLITSSTYEGDLKSISPPPLYTPPTPSLWQTPLLLETTTVAVAAAAPVQATAPSATMPQVANVAPQPSVATTLQNSSIMVGCVTPTVQTVGSTTNLSSPSLTTTAMAKVAPIIVYNTPSTPPTSAPLSPSSSALSSLQNLNQCLPPSKFHNHTLAQHLQKVECLKKSKKLNQQPETEYNNDNNKIISISTSPHPHSHETASTPTSTASLQSINCTSSPVKHSESEDLNEIPVNVIFRMAMVPHQQQQQQQQTNEMINEKSSNNVSTPARNNTTTTAPPLPPPLPQIKTNLNKPITIPASKTTTTTNQIIKQQQINTSSIQQQNNATKPLSLKFSSQQQEQQLQQPAVTVKTEILNTQTETEEKSVEYTKKLTHTSSNKSSRKLHTSITNVISDLPYNWQMSDCSTTKGAVAIVKMSQHNIDLDTTPLATAAGLPYCLQQHWFNSYNYHKSSELSAKNTIYHSLAREERIALYKQQLRRQAMQLLSTRSLQKVPLKVARRRLLCVDRLWRKYQQNEKELPANVKCCCFNGCDGHALEMASHCQRHIVYNAAQHVFLPCTAKFADNTQCRVPVFDITHDLPLCIEHARKRDAYNRLLYEQRPRKISAPTSILMNETLVMASKVSAVAGGERMIIKTQNYQQHQLHSKQQQQQQQLVGNNNKRPTLVNQQARKRKMNVGGIGNPVGRPQKRVKKSVEITNVPTSINRNQQQQQLQMPRLTSTNLKRKSSTTSLESIATSNSQHSITSSTSQQQQHQQLYGLTSSETATTTTTATTSLSTTTTTSLPPPALAPLSSGGLMMGHHNHHHHGLPQHLFSFGHDNHHPNINNINDKHSLSSTASVSSTTPTELKDFMSQFSFNAHRNQHPTVETIKTGGDTNLLNTNSNSNFTSSGMGSTTSLPTADDFLTQDMLSICENSSASSADTGLGGLSDPELMLGGPDDDIPLGDTHLLEEHDLANVLNSLPEDAFKELFATVHQDESDEIERAIELADKHLKTLQQTIGSELGDFLDFNDDMLMDNSDMCNTATVSANSILDTTALFIGTGGEGVATASDITTTLVEGTAVKVAGGGLVANVN